MSAVAQRQSVALWTRRRRVRLSPADPELSARCVGRVRFEPPESGSGNRRLESVTHDQDTSWNCGREVRHLLVKQDDEGFESLQFRSLVARRELYGCSSRLLSDGDGVRDPGGASIGCAEDFRAVARTGCGVTLASKSWELVVTVRFCPPRPFTHR